MLPAKLIKITEEVLDLDSIMKKYNLNQTNIIPTKFVTLTIKDWPCELTNMFSYTVMKLIPTKRFGKISVKSDDSIVLNNHVITRLSFINIDSKCPLKKIAVIAKHNKDTPNPIKIYTDILLTGYTENVPFMVLGPGKNCEIKLSIIESAGIDAETNHNFANTFIRKNMRVTDCDNVDFTSLSCLEAEYNQGDITFNYQDSKTAAEVLSLATEIILKKVQQVEIEFEELFKPSIGKTSLTIPSDPSGILANLFQIWIYFYLGRTVFITVDVALETVIHIKNSIQHRSKILEAIKSLHGYISIALKK